MLRPHRKEFSRSRRQVWKQINNALLRKGKFPYQRAFEFCETFFGGFFFSAKSAIRQDSATRVSTARKLWTRLVQWLIKEFSTIVHGALSQRKLDWTAFFANAFLSWLGRYVNLVSIILSSNFRHNTAFTACTCVLWAKVLSEQKSMPKSQFATLEGAKWLSLVLERNVISDFP